MMRIAVSIYLTIVFVFTVLLGESGAGSLGLENFKFFPFDKPSSGPTDDLPQLAPLKTGTTIVALCCKDGVVLGADTRSTGGPLVMDKNKRKIHQIGRKIFACAAGTSADCDQLTRKTAHFLGLVRIEKELAGVQDLSDSLVTAVSHISETIIGSVSGRKPQSVLLLGGVDTEGPSLYQMSAEGVPTKISYGALGSGSTDALAVLESARQSWRRSHDTIQDSLSNPILRENISVEDATAVVRRAVQAGILNDLGSGSHVDLCVVTAQGATLWRESLVSSWDADRLDISKYTTPPNADSDSSSLPRVAREGKLGKVIYRRLGPQRRITTSGVVEETLSADCADECDGNLAMDIEMIE